MEHQFYLDRLSAYFDMELKNEEYAIVHEHIQGCDECQKQLQELEKLENLISANTELSENDYWEQSAQKIESAISGEVEPQIIDVKKSSTSGLWWKLTGVAASLVLVAIFAFEQKDSKDELLLDEIRNETVDDGYIDSSLTKEVDTVYQEDVVDAIDVEVKSEASQAGRIRVNKEESRVAQSDNLVKKTKQTQLETKEIETNSQIDKDNLIDDKPRAVKQKTKTVQPALSETVSKPIPEKIHSIELDDGKVITVTNNGMNIQDSEKQDIGKTIQLPAEKVIDGVTTDDSKVKSKTQALDTFRTAPPKKKLAQASKRLSETVQSNSYAGKSKSEPIISNGQRYEIEYWRRQVAEYTKQLNDQQNKKVRYMKKSSESEIDSTDVSVVDIKYTYTQLFKAYYKIALVTTDSTEEKQAVQFLKKHADSVSFKSAANALYYLEEYKREKIWIESIQKQNDLK